MAISWTGFVHPHQTVLLRACVGTTPKSCDTSPMEALHSADKGHVFQSLNLQPFQVCIYNMMHCLTLLLYMV